MTESTYEPCDRCKKRRAAGELKEAIRCGACGGTGIIAKGPICNGCCGSLYPPSGDHNAQHAYGLQNVVLLGGYGSTGLLDMTRYTFSLCEVCIRAKILMTCKIPPRVETLGPGMLSWEPVDFAEDQATWEYAEWSRNGGHATASLHGICNATNTCGKPAAYSIAFSGHVGDECVCEEHKDKWANCSNAAPVPYVSWHNRHMPAEERQASPAMRWLSSVVESVCQVLRCMHVAGGPDWKLMRHWAGEAQCQMGATLLRVTDAERISDEREEPS